MMIRPYFPVAFAWMLALLAGAACGDEEQDVAEEAQPASRPPTQAAVPGFTRVTDAMLSSAAAGPNWPTHGGTFNNQRYSALDQINRENVGALVPVWIYQTGIAESFVTTPLVIDNAMYVTTPESHVVALNAATGQKLWEYIPALEDTRLCCGPDNQGVAAYDDKVYLATLDARVVALDHRTGAVVWETRVADPEEGYSQTMAPLAYDGKIFVGVTGAEYGVRGFVAALDARTGEEVWRWHTVAAPGDDPVGWHGEWKETDPFGAPLQRDILYEQELVDDYSETWKRGGGSVRSTPAYDPRTRILYVTVGGPAPSLDGAVRPGDNLYTGSIVALDGTTGKPRWYFQYLPHDVWDLSGGSPPILFEAGGRTYLGHAGKTGWVYILDAATGRPILRSDNFVPQENLFARPTEEGTKILPGANGGNGGAPVAYSPSTGLVYTTAIHQPMVLASRFQPWQEGTLWLGGSFRLIPDEPSWGTLSAIDPRTGEIRWQRQSPVPILSAALATAGGLLFVGQGTGTLDAFDAATGQLLWQFPTGAGVHGGPVTYAVNGVQYVVVASGGHYQLDTPRGDAVIAFALFDKRPTTVFTRYPEPSYTRHGPVRYGAARQVPASQVAPSPR